MKAWKKILVAAAIVVAIVAALTAYCHFAPWREVLAVSLSFIAGAVAGIAAKAWHDKHVAEGL